MKSINSKTIIFSLIIVTAIAVVVFLINQKTSLFSKAAPATKELQINQEVSELNSTQDLNTQTENIDSIDLNQIDTVLDQEN